MLNLEHYTYTYIPDLPRLSLVALEVSVDVLSVEVLSVVCIQHVTACSVQ